MYSTERSGTSTVGVPVWQELIAAGIRAPSGDNCQPWEFHRQGDDRLSIDILPERAKSFFDYQHHGTYLSVGAVVENMRIQAAGAGFGCRVSYPGGDRPGEPAAIVQWRRDDGVHSSEKRLRAMLERTVNRRPFLPTSPSTEQLDRICEAPVEGTRTQVYTQRRDIRTLARIIYLADRIRYSHPEIHRELFSKILFNRAQIEEKRMGLEYDRLGVGPGAAGILTLLKSWERFQRLSRFGVDKVLANQARMLALASGAIVLVTIPAHTPEAWMRAGEQVDRLWVRAQEEGLCVHPMAVAPYLVQRYEAEGLAHYLPAHEQFLRRIGDELQPFLGERVGAMIFRLGRGWKMGRPAVRLPLEDFLSAVEKGAPPTSAPAGVASPQ